MCEITISDIIQIIIIVILFFTAYYIRRTVKASFENIKLQRKYIELVTRPWVYFKLENDVLCDNVNKQVVINSKFYNVGASPALECMLIMQLTSEEEYPKIPSRSFFRRVTKRIMVFPKEEIGIYTVTLPVSLENEDNAAVQNAIMRMPYLHTYLTYKSEDRENYYLRQRFKIEYYNIIKDDNIQVIWHYISGDTKPLK